jgi:hypothetical protein
VCGSALHLVGTLRDVNTFHVSSSDLVTATDIILSLPAFVAAVNASLRTGGPLPTTSIIINVLFDVDYTGYGPDPNKTTGTGRVPARTVVLDAFGMNGLFAERVSCVVLAVCVGPCPFPLHTHPTCTATPGSVH